MMGILEAMQNAYNPHELKLVEKSLLPITGVCDAQNRLRHRMDM